MRLKVVAILLVIIRDTSMKIVIERSSSLYLHIYLSYVCRVKKTFKHKNSVIRFMTCGLRIEQFQRFCEYLIAMYLTEYFIQEGYYNSCGKCKIEKSLKLKKIYQKII